jgi:hypothetical protein
VFTHIPGFEKKTSTQNCCIYLAIDFNCNLVPSHYLHKVVTIFWVATEAWTFSFSNGYKKHYIDSGKRVLICWTISVLAGHIIDNSTGDVAVDQYHRMEA